MIKSFLGGVIAAVVAALVGAYIFIVAGGVPVNADAKPPAIERWAAHRSLHAVIAREEPPGPNPVALTDENLLAGLRLYAVNCAVCHGAADARPSNIAKGLYQHPPQFGKPGIIDDGTGEIYWKVYHGIRFTGMPSFRWTLDDTQLWQLTLFLKNLDTLPPPVEKAWKALPSPAQGA